MPIDFVAQGLSEFYAPDESRADRTYFYSPDNRMRSAYRFRRTRPIRGQSSITGTRSPEYADLLIIDAVYLGEANNASLAEISSPDWWKVQEAVGKVVSRICPSTGAVSSTTNVDRACLRNFPLYQQVWGMGGRLVALQLPAHGLPSSGYSITTDSIVRSTATSRGCMYA